MLARGRATPPDHGCIVQGVQRRAGILSRRETEPLAFNPVLANSWIRSSRSTAQYGVKADVEATFAVTWIERCSKLIRDWDEDPPLSYKRRRRKVNSTLSSYSEWTWHLNIVIE